MKNATTIMLAATALISVSAFADAGLDLAKSKQCLTCHAVKGISSNDVPSFQSIAEKYKNRHAYEDMLITQIIGSPPINSYHWGSREMVPPAARPKLTVKESNELLDWILSQKK